MLHLDALDSAYFTKTYKKIIIKLFGFFFAQSLEAKVGALKKVISK